MRILIANRRLCGYTGTEVVTRDLALAFQALGHEPVVYSPWHGGPAASIAAKGVAVLRDVRALGVAPDVVHGNHPKVLLDALGCFPAVPAVAVCHDATSPRDEPIAHPRILRYVAVDERCRQRFERAPAVPRDRILVRLNAVDLRRFLPRPPLPAVPARALVFSNNASWRTHVRPLQAACERVGLALDVIGEAAGAQLSRPETALGRYDVVFAKARCALEALATGAAVVLCDAAGLGPMVTTANLQRLRRFNFGQGVLTSRHTVEAILAELRRYDTADAAAVSRRVRAEAGLDRAASEWIQLYQEIVEEARARPAEAAAPATQQAIRRRFEWEARIERQEAWWRAVARLQIAGSTLARIGRRLSLLWPR